MITAKFILNNYVDGRFIKTGRKAGNATYFYKNGEEGTIALIGPKRMEYDKAEALLNYIKENIGKE